MLRFNNLQIFSNTTDVYYKSKYFGFCVQPMVLKLRKNCRKNLSLNTFEELSGIKRACLDLFPHFPIAFSKSVN